MSDGKIRQTIPEEVLRARLARAEDLREFFIQMWLANPQLVAQGGATIREIMSPPPPLEERRWKRD